MGLSALIAVRVPITRIHTTSALTIVSHRLEIFRLPYELYVDASPGQALYRALGMGHSRSSAHKTRPTTEGSATGSYVRHGAVSGLAMVVRHALRVAMPVWERGGDAAQLGGEFVLGPGYVPKPPYIFPLPDDPQAELHVCASDAELRGPCSHRGRTRGCWRAACAEERRRTRRPAAVRIRVRGNTERSCWRRDPVGKAE